LLSALKVPLIDRCERFLFRGSFFGILLGISSGILRGGTGIAKFAVEEEDVSLLRSVRLYLNGLVCILLIDLIFKANNYIC